MSLVLELLSDFKYSYDNFSEDGKLVKEFEEKKKKSNVFKRKQLYSRRLLTSCVHENLMIDFDRV